MTEIDFSSGVSGQYQTHFEELLKQARVKNDGTSLTDAETNQIRGRIALLKELIALPNKASALKAQSSTDHQG